MNTVFDQLDLTQGNVSNAIFHAAGPKLQQLVNAKNASGTVGEIIATDGCKLKSKHVFHAVTPHWNQGQGEKVEFFCVFNVVNDLSDLNLVKC